MEGLRRRWSVCVLEMEMWLFVGGLRPQRRRDSLLAPWLGIGLVLLLEVS